MTDLREEIAKIILTEGEKLQHLEIADLVLSLPLDMVRTKDGISRDLTLGEQNEVLEMLLKGEAQLVPAVLSANVPKFIIMPDGSRIEMKEGE